MNWVQNVKNANFLQKRKKIVENLENLENDTSFLSITFLMHNFFPKLKKSFFKEGKTNYKTAKINLNFSRISLIEIPAGIFPQP